MRNMKRLLRGYIPVLVVIAVLTFSAAALAYTYTRATYPVLKHIPTPKSVLGYDIGEEGYLTYYSDIVKYYETVDKASNRVEVVEIGKSTEGRPMVIAIVTAPENFAKLDYYKSIIKTLADPREITKEESDYLVSVGKPVILIEPSMHSTEVSGAEMCMGLLYKLAAYTDPRVKEILDNTITLILPTSNPDGRDMVTEWYYKYKGTTYEGTWPPNYHKYIGHDNNRDYLAFQIVESEVLASSWNEWLPTVHYSLHQMGQTGYRINYVPHADVATYFEVHPTVLSEWITLGGHVQNDLASKGLKGYACVQYAGALWYPGSTVGYTLGHYSTGTFSETAGTWGGTSVYVDPARLSASAKEQRWYHWAPWPGGWWSLKDTTTYEEITAFAILSCVAKYHEQFLGNFAMRIRDHYEKGLTVPPYAFVLPPLAQQKDPATAAKLLNRLIFDLVEVQVANKPFVADGVTYPAGSYVILMAQPMREWAKTLLEVQKYPPVPPYPTPYDVTAWTRGYMMGVDVIQINEKFSADLSLVKKVVPPAGEVIGAPATYAYVFSHEMNNAIIAVNRLLKDGYKVYWTAEPFTLAAKTWPAGTIIVPVSPNLHTKVASLAKDLYLKFYGTNTPLTVQAYELKQPRIGLYLPVVGGKSNMEEGHTRRILELYEFSFKEGVLDAEIIAGNLNEKYDVLIMADGSSRGYYTGPTPPYPLPGGLGAAGAASLRDFVEKGGTLIGIGGGGGLFPIDYFGIDLGVKRADTTTLFCPGTVLRIKVDNTHPIGYGMKPEAAAFFWASPAYDVTTAKTVSWYPDKDLFMSGYITGESKLYNKGAVVDAPLGDGHIILIGFSVLQRGQADNTFMLLFNSIYYGAAELTSLP